MHKTAIFAFVLMALLATCARAGWHNVTIPVGHLHWKESTTFDAALLPVPANVPYQLLLKLTFTDVTDLYVLRMRSTVLRRQANGNDKQSLSKFDEIVQKDKVLEDTVVLQNLLGAQPGWMSDNLQCGYIAGSLKSKVALASLTIALWVDDSKIQPMSEQQYENCKPMFDDAGMVVASLFLPLLLLAVLLLVCFCGLCCLCCARRAQCRSTRCRAAPAAAQVTAAEPAVNEAPKQEAYLIPAAAMAAGTQYFVPIPADFQAPSGAQYVQLVPIKQ